MGSAAIFTHFEYKVCSYYVLTSSNLVFLISKNNMKQTVTIVTFEVRECNPLICVACYLHYWVSCANYKRGFFWDCIFVVDTHLPRFEALAHVLPHFDALTHVVILVYSAFIFQRFAEVWYSVFVKRSSLKSLLNLPKAYIDLCLLNCSKRSSFRSLLLNFTLD